MALTARPAKPPGLRPWWILLLALLVAGCARFTEPPPGHDRADGLASLPGWAEQAALDDWLQAWQRSCERRPWSRPQTLADPAAWAAACESARERRHVDRAWLGWHFRIGRIADDALVTGYFEPSFRGARKPGPAYAAPLYQPPPEPELARLSRARIDAGGLAGRGLELAWLADPVDAFFLHIQGSGRIVLADGGSQRVGYAGDNGHRYRAIGRDLVAEGEIARDAVSMQSIAAWLRRHPDRAAAMMQRNPRYIFFRPLATEGPVGAQGVVLTPERSLAVDPGHIPYGLPVWLDVEHPDAASRMPLRRLTVAQDTGSAIKGAARADFFWGAGDRAEALAGRMQSRGRLYVLLPRPAN